MIKAERQVAKILDLIKRLKEEGNKNPGYCATGLNDYGHSHAWASDCYACVERDNKRKIADLLQKTLED